MRAHALTTLAICLALALGACGDDEGTAEAPALPGGLSAELAGQSEQVAATLASGDDCGAAAQAAVLQASVNSAIAAGGVPEPLQAEVRAGADRISSGIVCEPAPAPHTTTEETTTTPTTPDCDTLQRLRDQLEEQKKRAEGIAGDDPSVQDQIKDQLKEQRKVLDERLKDFCEGKHGDEGGPGNSDFGHSHNPDPGGD